MKRSTEDSYQDIINSLAIMKRFLKRREYIRVEKMCFDLISGEERKRLGNVKLEYIPSLTDFVNAVQKVRIFLFHTDNEAYKNQDVESNDKGREMQPTELNKEDTKIQVVELNNEDRKLQSAELNKHGFHSKTVLDCMNVLFRKRDYMCIQDLCMMIDDDDFDRQANEIKRMLLENRNNLTSAGRIQTGN